MFFVVLTKKRLLIISSIVLAIIVIISILFGTGVVGAFNSNKKRLPIYSVEREDKKIAISFDCAWGTDYTDSLLNVMQEKDVKCTFFMVEFWTRKYPDFVKKIDQYGHEIGTHSATHPYMSKLDKKTIIKELESSAKAISDITNKKVELFRAPYGDYNDRLIQTAEEQGLYTIQWSIDSLDWKDISSDEIVKRVTGKIHSGAIILFHNQGLNTAKALPTIIDRLKSDGYQFVSIGELIYKKNYTILPNGTQRQNS